MRGRRRPVRRSAATTNVAGQLVPGGAAASSPPPSPARVAISLRANEGLSSGTGSDRVLYFRPLRPSVHEHDVSGLGRRRSRLRLLGRHVPQLVDFGLVVFTFDASHDGSKFVAVSGKTRRGRSSASAELSGAVVSGDREGV